MASALEDSGYQGSKLEWVIIFLLSKILLKFGMFGLLVGGMDNTLNFFKYIFILHTEIIQS